MTHPTNEQWMTLLYGEAPAAERATLEAHLAGCDQCRSTYAAWRETCHELDAWKLDPKRASKRQKAPALAWAAAAAVLALAAVGEFHVWTLEKEVGRLRSERNLSAQSAEMSRAEMRRLVADAAAESDRKRSADRQAFFAALEKLQAADAERYAVLRKELETVAVLTEAGFQRAQSEIANIAYSPRDNSQQ